MEKEVDSKIDNQTLAKCFEKIIKYVICKSLAEEMVWLPLIIQSSPDWRISEVYIQGDSGM